MNYVTSVKEAIRDCLALFQETACQLVDKYNPKWISYYLDIQ